MSTSSMNISSKTIHSPSSPITSVYIPRVFSNIHPNVISQTFERQNIGVVDHIQVIQRPKKKGKSPAYMAFIYFKEWFSNQSALHLAERIVNPEKQARVVYDDPYYWIVLPNTNTKGKGKSTSQVSSASSPQESSSSSSQFNIEKTESLYLMIEDLQERVKHIEEYLCILHKYNSLTQLPSSPVSHPDDVYNYNYNNVDPDTEADYTYSYSDDDNGDIEVGDSSHRSGLFEYYDSPNQKQVRPNSPKMVRVDSLGLVYKETDVYNDSRFWCDP